MAEPAVRKATYEDLLQVPQHLVAEILGGELYAHPRRAPRHANASSIIGIKIGGPFHLGGGGPGGWRICGHESTFVANVDEAQEI